MYYYELLDSADFRYVLFNRMFQLYIFIKQRFDGESRIMSFKFRFINGRLIIATIEYEYTIIDKEDEECDK